MKPFLKWAGGKHRLLDRINDVLPTGSRLIEPFAGSGAVFLGTSFERYLVSDANKDLIHLFVEIKRDSESIIDEVIALFTPENNKEDAFYSLRDEFNQRRQDSRKAALFVYLNRHCFNGLCRYNKSGKFNVPFGRYKAPTAPIEGIRAFARKSTAAEFVSEDFRITMRKAKPGDVVYCDPPYVPISATANFTSYAQGDFTIEDQIALAQIAQELAERGVPVVISNHATDITKTLYQKASIAEFGVQRFISRDANNRAIAKELLAVYLPEAFQAGHNPNSTSLRKSM